MHIIFDELQFKHRALKRYLTNEPRFQACHASTGNKASGKSRFIKIDYGLWMTNLWHSNPKPTVNNDRAWQSNERVMWPSVTPATHGLPAGRHGFEYIYMYIYIRRACHPWWSLLGRIPWYPAMKSSLCNSFEDRTPADGIYGCSIFKWVAVISLHERVPR